MRWAAWGSGSVTWRAEPSDFERSIALFEELGDAGGIAYSLFLLGLPSARGWRAPTGKALHAESLLRARQVDDAWLLSFALSINGNQAWLAGEFVRAEALYREGTDLPRDIGAKWPIAECLWGLAGLAAAQGHVERAARLNGAERATRAAIGAVVLGDVSRFERDMAAARAAMGEVRFEAVAAEGRALALERGDRVWLV